MKKSNSKYSQLLNVVLLLGVIIVVNLLASFYFFRVDLTEDKIHSLNQQTKTFLTQEVSDVINIEIFLKSDDLPPVLQKYKQQMKDKLEEFKAYSGNKIKYKFTNLMKDSVVGKKWIQEFTLNQVSANQIEYMDQGSAKIHTFWPIAIVRSGQKTVYLDFFNESIRVSEDYIEEKSNTLEYDFLSAFYQLTNRAKPTISFLRGHGELSTTQLSSIRVELNDYYNIDTVRIVKFDQEAGKFYHDIRALDNTDLLVIAKPLFGFTDKELFIIDQHVMQGGRLIAALDMVDSNEDSLGIPGKYFTFSAPMSQLESLESMLYKYGCGIKSNFVTNKICAPQYRYDYWNQYYYDNAENQKQISNTISEWYPAACVTMANSDLTKNIGRIKLDFPSPININKNTANVNHEVILETDISHRLFPAIYRVRYDDKFIFPDLSKIEKPGKSFDPGPYENPKQIKTPLGALITGEFKTVYPQEFLPPEFIEGLKQTDFKYKTQSSPTAVAVIGDGDLFKNEVIPSQSGQPQVVHIGMQYISGEPNAGEIIYGNAVFIHNLIDKMMNNEYLIPLRSRMKTPRFLNKDEVFYNREKWQWINLLIPVIFVSIFGALLYYYRRSKNTRI